MRKVLLISAGIMLGLAAVSNVEARQFDSGQFFDPNTKQWIKIGPGGNRKYSRIRRQKVSYDGPHRKGTIIINTSERRLYLVLGDGKALKYGVGVGREGFSWKGTERVTRKKEWPDWRPPADMLMRQPELPHFVPGGPRNPLGARALYLGTTLYRIHGSNEPWTIGRAVSSGCIRMRNEDVMDLYDRVAIGATVVVL